MREVPRARMLLSGRKRVQTSLPGGNHGRASLARIAGVIEWTCRRRNHLAPRRVCRKNRISPCRLRDLRVEISLEKETPRRHRDHTENHREIFPTDSERVREILLRDGSGISFQGRNAITLQRSSLRCDLW